MAHKTYVYVTASTVSVSNEPEIDLTWLRNTYDNSEAKKEEKLKKKLRRVRSLGK